MLIGSNLKGINSPAGFLQGFAGVSGQLARGATLWTAAPLPQNRDVWAAASGDGSLHLYRYHYPDQR